ncbi:DUF6249 domain-containing protein [Caulobacter sp. RHG1]|uniref:DUF6249 domain-containing protein n=1 Tax=Caulobacter sp. (strain RHG1) TaxID=2545762 RepID=UPI0015566A4E|nr:DUF6249 domain-containing protein [Caulobacter sp. RHG1]NQE64257.1 hypothetical protein [Caulobacter sp. RHG1]
MEDVIVPIAFFACIAAVCITPVWLKSRDRKEMQATLRSAIEKGQPVPQEVIEALTRNVKGPPTALRDMRSGVIWLAIGLGIGGLGAMIGIREEEALHPLLGIAIIPSVIGLALIALSFFNPHKEPRV